MAGTSESPSKIESQTEEASSSSTEMINTCSEVDIECDKAQEEVKESPGVDSSDDISEVCEFYKAGKCRFGDNCRNSHPGGLEGSLILKSKKKSKEKKKKPKEDVIVKKKPPMKTAGDVRDRILWDSALPSEYFSIGYVDRFAGLVEKPFSSFSWCDLSDAGPDELAIPQHCLSYFKYKGSKVWDKETRMDHVFGSAGNNMKIIEKMASIDREIEEKLALRNSDDEDSDDDDDFCFEPVPLNLGIAKDFQEEDHALRASHFLCIKVKNESLKEKVKEVQDSVVMGDPTLRSCRMPQELLHVTLTMVYCESLASLVKVNTLLRELKPKLSQWIQEASDSCDIEAKGLSTFGARVLYVQLKVPEIFQRAVDIIAEKIRTMPDVTVTNNFNFVPHMTLLKINRPTERERRSKYMSSILYDDYLTEDFGSIKFDNIHFCSIDDYRGPDGFYKTEFTVDF